VKAGQIQEAKAVVARLIENEYPLVAPSGWIWSGFGRLRWTGDRRFPTKDFTYIDVKAIDKELGRVADAKVLSPTEAPSRARKLVNTGDVLYSCVRPYLLNIAVIRLESHPPQ